MPRKLLDTSRLESLGWKPRIGLQEGIEQTYHWFSSQPVGEERHEPKGTSETKAG